MNCPICGKFTTRLGGGWVHHARTHVKEGKIRQSICPSTYNYVFYYRTRRGGPVEPWRGGPTWEDVQRKGKRQTSLYKSAEFSRRAEAELKAEAYKTAKLYMKRRRIPTSEALRLELAALVADSEADGLYSLASVAAAHKARIGSLRKVANQLRREATIAQSKRLVKEGGKWK